MTNEDKHTETKDMDIDHDDDGAPCEAVDVVQLHIDFEKIQEGQEMRDRYTFS